MARRFGLDSKQKLKSRKLIAEVFEKGKRFSVHPLRVSYLLKLGVEVPGIQIGVSASKRNFKRAVDRNRIKRLLREAYRLQKIPLVTVTKEAGVQGAVFFMYSGNEMTSFKEISLVMAKALEHLQKRISNEKPQ